MRQEIKSLTGLRGIAALWVVVFHFFGDLDIPIIKNIIKQGYVSVDIFFVLSAFVLTIAYQNKFKNAIQYNDFITFYKKRINRIYPAYLLSLLIMMIVSGSTLKQFIINFGLTQTFFDRDGIILNIVYWSLSTEWICYLIFPFLLLIINNLSKNKLLIIILFGIILRFSLPFLPDMAIGVEKFRHHPPGANFTIGINALIRTISCYFIGIGLALYPLKNKSNMNIYIFTILSILSLAHPKGVFLTPIFVAMIIKYLHIDENNLIGKLLSNRVVYFLGEISYSLYLFHMIFVYIGLYVFESNFWNTVLWLILSIIISTITYHLIEKKVKFFKV